MLKPLFPKKTSKSYPGSIVRTHKLLARMQEAGLIHSDRDHNNQPLLWMLPETTFPENFYTRRHELDVADLFVAYYPHFTHWDTKWGVFEREKLNIPFYKVNYDARMVLNGKVYLWEVDRGTEDIEKQLVPKIDKYIALAKSLPYGSFQVILTLQKYRRMDLERRAGELAYILQENQRGNQFLIASHQKLLSDPLGKNFISPLSPMERKSLPELPYGV